MHAVFILLVSLFLISRVGVSEACESCTIANLGKREKVEENKKPSLIAKVLYENQDWQEDGDAMALHEMHHDGFHVHNKQDEEIIHTILTGYINERLSFNINIPYVTKHYIEIDSHHHAGENQTSRGLGDITVTGDYRLIQEEEKSFGIIAGVKTPSGETDEHNSFGGLMEPELQPGTGSLDYIGGLAGSLHPNDMDYSVSAIYIYRTEGEQDFRFGDLLSVSLYAGKRFDLNEKFKLRTGVMLNQQLEKKQNDAGGDIKDSGGYTLLIGPQVSLGFEQFEVELSYLAPAVQNLGGVHQELDNGMWTAGLSGKF